MAEFDCSAQWTRRSIHNNPGDGVAVDEHKGGMLPESIPLYRETARYVRGDNPVQLEELTGKHARSGGCSLIILLKDVKRGSCQADDDRSQEKTDEAKIGQPSKRSKKEHDEWQVNS